MLKDYLSDKFFLALVFFSIAYFGFWILHQSVIYATFQAPFYDTGIVAYSLYWHVNQVQLMSPFQYLVFYGHLAPFSLLIVPIFAVFPYAITPIVFQEIFLLLTALLIYFVAVELIKNRKFAFMFAMAFLLGPEIVGVLIYGFHSEALVPFFSILAFYFYMKGNTGYFLLSYLFLLSIMELTFVIGLALVFSLLAYELFYNRTRTGVGVKQRRKKLGTLLIAFGLSIAAFLFYSLATLYIINSYAQTPTSAITPISRLPSYYIAGQLHGILNPTPSTQDFTTTEVSLIGAILVFFGFGILSLAAPLVSLILVSPWLAEVFIVHNYSFEVFQFQYYALVAGGSYISAVLGYLIVSKYKKNWISSFFNFNKNTDKILIISLFLILYLLAITFYHLQIAWNGLYPQPLNYAQIDQAIGTIPSNAGVLAQASIAPHLYRIHNLELPPTDSPEWFTPTNITVFWFKPDYIVLDRQLQNYNDLVNYSFNVYAYMANNYTSYYNSSGLCIFKRIR